MAAAPGADLRGPPGARPCRDRMARSGGDRGARGIRRAGALEYPGVGGEGMGDQRGCDQRDGRLDRHRPSVRRDGRAHRHDPRERDGPPRRAVRPAVDLRAARHGFRHGPGAPLMPPGPAGGAALTCELADGAVAVVTFDLKNESVNKISRTVKDDVLATLAALEGDRAVQAIAFFSRKRDNFIAGAGLEEVVCLTPPPQAERPSAHGPALLDPAAPLPQPVPAGTHR